MHMDTVVTLSWWMTVPLVVVGTLLHFAYDWSGHRRWVAVFSAVNESYWEHTKLAVWPVALWLVVLFALGGHQHTAFIPAATISLFSIPLTMVGIVVLYKRVTGRNVLWLDIAVFALVIVLSQTIFVQMIQQLAPGTVTVALSIAYLVGMLGAFVTHTLSPPDEPDIFIDPITGKYGIDGH